MISPAIRQETVIFLLAALHGIFLTVGYDLLRGLRRAIPHSGLAVSIEDFFYWLVSGFLTFLMAYFISEGVLRGYAAMAMVLGALLYLETGSRAVQKTAAVFFGFFCFLVQKSAWFAGKICGKGLKLKRKKGTITQKRRVVRKKQQDKEGSEMAGKKRTGKKKPNRSNLAGVITIAGIVAVLLVVLLSGSQKLSVRNEQYESQKEELSQQIQDEEVRSGEIEKLKDYVNSKEFIEKMAREKLGLVYRNEIIFKAAQ